MGLALLDYVVLGGYAVMLVAVAWTVSREKGGATKNTNDYFLASNALPWWAVGASLIAANISAEQVIGMSGSGFALGLGIASYEWMAALTLLIVGKYFLPIFLKKGIYTMPQFLEQRFNGTVRSVMAVFWLGVYTLVNLTSILWLGALAVNALTGLELFYGLVALAAFAAVYSLYGGLKAVALTDIVQVVMLILGGVFIAYLTLDAAADGAGPVAGLGVLMEKAPGKFDMILDKENPFYADLPGLSVLIGGLWIMNLSYWGFNQYIIQRALAAKSQKEAQLGIVFAAFLKLLVPVLVVLPGIAAFVLHPDIACADGASLVAGADGGKPVCQPGEGNPNYDLAYPTMMGLAPEGVRGLIFAALVAAIVSSLGSMMNSIATIFTMDLYRPVFKSTSENRLVWIGRTVALTALIIAVIAARPLLGNAEQAFQYIQEFTGFFTPGIVALFLLGMFWKKTTALGALAAAMGSAVFSLAFKIGLPAMPFMNRVGYVFILCVTAAVLVSLFFGRGRDHENAIDHAGVSFATSRFFNIAAAVLAAVLIALYWLWW